MEIEKIDKLLDCYPINIVGNPLLVCLLENVSVIRDAEKFERELDALSLLANKRYVIWSDSEKSFRFPKIKIESELNVEAINEKISNDIDIFSKVLTKQSEIKNIILRSCFKYDVVGLVIVDGLSYFDVEGFVNCTPCFVDGITKTYEGYKNIIGDPTLGRNIFLKGFSNLIGFSYWDREVDAELTREIFIPFGMKEPTRVESFEQILNKLKRSMVRKSYIQIVTHGLDQLCHKNYEEPLIEGHVVRLLNNFKGLKKIIEEKGFKGLICLTSDHGILWKHKASLKIIDEPSQDTSHSPRYLDGKILRSYALSMNCFGKNYSLIRYPFITRSLRNNEWGVHGGISAYESIIPLIIEEVL
jgi:hypothetical protein